MTVAGGQRRALLIEPDPGRAGVVMAALEAAGVQATWTPDAETGWQRFAQAPAQVVLTVQHTPRRDAGWLIARMRQDWMGEPPAIFVITDESELSGHLSALELDGVILAPPSAAALGQLAQPLRALPPAQQAARLADLFALTVLGEDQAGAQTRVLDRLCTLFGAEEALLVRPDGVVSRKGAGGEQDRLAELARSALITATPITAYVDEGGVYRDVTVMAVPLALPGGTDLGALAVVTAGARRFSGDDVDALRLFARRMAMELTWTHAHEQLGAALSRVSAQAERDEQLGVLTAQALERELDGLLNSQQSPPVITAIDVVELRSINDRLGHAAGDAALQRVVEVVERHLPEGARLGRVAGDEFCVALPEGTLPAAQAILELCRRDLADAEAPGGAIRLRAGLARLAPGDLGDQAITRARAALLAARRADLLTIALGPGDSAEVANTGVVELPPTKLDRHVPDSDILPSGTMLGGMYQIRHEISRGAMGVVYRAQDLGLERAVAVKVLRAELARDQGLVTRFRAEAAMLAQLRHEHLVQVHAFGTRDQLVYFVMELVEGEALSDLIHRADQAGEPVPIELVRTIVTQIAGALDAMHQGAALHRDVKPANILLDRTRGRAVLVDVGIFKRHDNQRSDAAGTPGFAAPESLTRTDEAPSADVYGLAATTYMLLTGIAPFGGTAGADMERVLERQLGAPPIAPSRLRRDLPPAADHVLLKALLPEPHLRFETAGAYAAALSAALATPVKIMPPRASSPPPLPPGAKALGAMVGMRPKRPTLPAAGPPSSRGSLFRVAYRVLGNRLGAAWLAQIIEADPALAQVLRNDLPPGDWQPTTLLTAVCKAVPREVRDPRKVARELARAAMVQTLAAIVGRDPATKGIKALLEELPSILKRYHSWAQARVGFGDKAARIELVGVPADATLGWYLEGMIERIAELGGAASARARLVESEIDGKPATLIDVHWQES